MGYPDGKERAGRDPGPLILLPSLAELKVSVMPETNGSPPPFQRNNGQENNSSAQGQRARAAPRQDHQPVCSLCLRRRPTASISSGPPTHTTHTPPSLPLHPLKEEEGRRLATALPFVADRRATVRKRGKEKK